MSIVSTIARILLGIVFTVAGAVPFFVSSPPPQPGLAGTFNEVFFHSHWAMFVGAAQVVMGILLLTNRFVTLALIMLAAFLYNSFAFHITMVPNLLVLPVVVLILWYLAARPYRDVFASLFRPVQH